MLDPPLLPANGLPPEAKMANLFNPYQAWLGLENGQTLDYYELLGLPRFAADAGQIAAAAERATTKVRSFRPGPHARAWSALLDEIQAAKQCLSDAARKAEYDERLRRGLLTPTATVSPARPGAALSPAHSELYPPVRGMAAKAAMADPMAPVGIDPIEAVVDDPMAPMAVAELLPPSAGAPNIPGVTSAAALPASELNVATAPSAARVARRSGRRAQRMIVFAVVGCAALIGAAAVMQYLASKPTGKIAAARAENETAAAPEMSVGLAPQVAESAKVIAASPLPSSPAETPAPVPTPMPEPAPAPTSADDAAVVSPQEPPKLTREELQALVKALATAKAALGEQNFKVAEAELSKAESLAKLPKHQEAVARLREAGGYLKQFREAVAAAVGGMQGGESFKVGGSTQVSFIEGQKDKVALRVAGMNKTYSFSDMPPGLALAIADFKLVSSDPVGRVVKGAYLAVHKRADSETQDKARALWQEAQAMGTDVSHLVPLLTDDYAAFLKDAAAK
jgi:hypothetical protein